MNESLKQLILLVLKKSENAMTLTQIKNSIFEEAIKQVTGTTSFAMKDIREAIQELIEEDSVNGNLIEKAFNAYEIKKEGDEQERSNE